MRLFVTTLFVCLFVATTATAQIQWDDIGVAVVTDFTGYTGAGFNDPAGAGQLSSAVFATTGMSDGDCDFYTLCDAGDFARGASTGGVTTGGFYAFEVETGNPALGIQPGGTDFTPGTVTYRIANFAGQVTDVTISYDLWIRNDQGRSQSVYLRWALNDGAFSKKIDSLATTEVADITPGWVKLSRSINIDLGMTVEQENDFNFRFETDDSTGSGSRDEIAIDNISTTPFSNLAAELTDFSALRLDSGLMLRWATSSEEDLSGFEIEQANQAGEFESIGFVSAAGPGSYQFVTQSNTARSFRLKIIDIDGTHKFSRAIETTAELTLPFELEQAFPNPFSLSSSFALRVRDSQLVTVLLYDALGRQVRTLFDGTMAANESRQIAVDADGLASGTYIYRVRGAKFVSSGRVVLGR